MQKTIEENLTIIKDTSVPLKKKIRKYKDSVELLEKYSDVINKLGNVKRKSKTEITINNIDEYMTKSQEILQSFENGDITLDKMETLIELKKHLIGLQRFVKEKKIETFVVKPDNLISRAHLEEKVLILDNEESV